MLLYIHHGGQLCNRLFAITPALTYAIHHGQKLHVFYADEKYMSLFPNLRECKNLCIHKNNNYYFHGFLDRLYNRKYFRIEEKLKRKKPFFLPSFINGWDHVEDVSFVEQYKDTIKRVFDVSDGVKKKIQEVLCPFEGITIGVHVRRGDYKDWWHGKYYYDDSVYLRIMKNLQEELYNKGEKCRFLICSNEPFNASVEGLNILRIPEAEAIEDLYGLSQCDYIVGPPSTFSQWAAFVGGKLLLFMMRPSDNPQIEDFSRIRRYRHFENGNRVIYNDALIQFEIVKK